MSRSAGDIVPGEIVKLAKRLGRTMARVYADPEGYSDGTLFEANEVGLVLALRSTYYGGERSLEGRRYAYLISSTGSIGWVWVDNLEVIR